jgi:hypothetical protein
MKNILSVLVLVLGISQVGYSRAITEDPQLLPVLIALGNGSMGSGCFLRVSNSIYLVTARHVLFSPATGTNAPQLLSDMAIISGYSHNRTNADIVPVKYTLNLAMCKAAQEIKFSKDHDVAIARVEEITGETNDTFRTKVPPWFSYDNFNIGIGFIPLEAPLRIKDVDIGAPVFMFGYPVSLTRSISDIFPEDYPLLRKGIVAGVNLKKKKIIIDCPGYPGNSGGPVLEVDQIEDSIPQARVFRYIGVVIERVNYSEEMENKTLLYSNTGYTIIEPLDTVLDLVWK